MRPPPSNRHGRPEGQAQHVPGLPARRAALHLLEAVLRQGLPLESALARAGAGLPGADRALAHAIAAEALRRLPDLDALIDGATRQRLPDDAKARQVLRLALVQALALGTPPHAAIATALPLVTGGPKRLVHGVFGAVLRSGAGLPDVPTLPEATAERWRAQWGDAMVEAAARAIAVQPPLDLSLRDAGETGAMAVALAGESLAPGHVRRVPASVVDLPGFDDGAWWVQDVAASIPARLIGSGPGTALDLCAAPGGKTLQLAAAGWSVTAVDASQSRIARLGDNLARTGLSAEMVTADLLDWVPASPVDAVLLDAPCSATGIFRRHPDVLHRVTPKLIAELAGVQAQLLARAADWVRPGGTLVYATCSLERAEGEEQLAAFLAARSDYAIAAPRDDELPTGITATADGWVRTLPGMLADKGGCDGFFVVRLRRS